MSNSTYIYTVPYVPETSPSYTQVQLLPNRNNCPEYAITGWVNELSESWNCNTCTGEKSYFSRYIKGDIIPFLLRLPDYYNTDISNPTVGWNYTGAANFYVEAELYGAGACVAPLYTVVDDFCSDWWVHYAAVTGSYQVLFVDTSLLQATEKNFRLKVTVYDATNTPIASVWSENFLEIEEDCTPNHVLIEAYYDTIDCLGNRYRQSTRFSNPAPFHQTIDPVNYNATAFYLSRRYLGQLVFSGQTAEYDKDDSENTLQSRIFDGYNLILQDFLPPYEAKIFGAQTRANHTYITPSDNPNSTLEYENFGALVKNLDLGRMFKVNIDCQRVCIINNRTCDTI